MTHPDPFFDMTEEEYQAHRANRIREANKIEKNARWLVGAFLALTLIGVLIVLHHQGRL
jgi:hypothetical protein